MKIKPLNSSWKTTAQEILSNDIKDLSETEKEILLQSFLSGAQTFMNQILVELDFLEDEINQKITDANYNIVARSAVEWAKKKIENCEIHLKK